MLQTEVVKSATNLISVMNDVLRSPHLSAHLSAHQTFPGCLPSPGYGRPRSHTAPPTPLVEAPHMDPVELPGSLLLDNLPTSLHQSIDGKGAPRYKPPSTHTAGLDIERPHTSPQASTHPLARLPDTLESSTRSSNVRLPALSLPRLNYNSPARVSMQAAATISTRAEEDTLVAREVDSTIANITRPTLTVVQRWASETPSIPGSTDLSHSGSAQARAQSQSPYHSLPPPQSELIPQDDTSSAYIEQISRMRSNHEAHLKSLKETHEKEIESNRSYVTFLERRCTPARELPSGPKQLLTIDTSQTVLPRGTTHSETSAATVQSFETSLESEKRTSHEAFAEVETLKRKLSLCRRSQTEFGDICRERDHFRESSERSDRRIVQLKDIVQKAKENEKALRNGTAHLEARLLDSGIQRTDLLEGFHESSRQSQHLAKRAHSLRQELDDLRGRSFYTKGRHASDTALLQPADGLKRFHLQPISDAVGFLPSNDALLQQIKDLKEIIDGKDTEIRRLRTQHDDREAVLTTRDENHHAHIAKIAELQISLADQKSMVKIVQAEKAMVLADCDRYNSLLHAELRRQSRCAAKIPLPRTPKVEAEAAAVFAEKLQSTKSSWLLGSAKLEETNAALEKELLHCTREIILYKLDIVGYKKDLTFAHAQLDIMSAVAKRPPTPDRYSGLSEKNLASEVNPRAATGTLSHETSTSGLGIAMSQPPRTPIRTVFSGTQAGLLSASSPTPSASVSPRTKTPLITHKKLPKPPSSHSPSPRPAQLAHVSGLHRGETIRSLSESIISSYAKRSPMLQDSGSSPFIAAVPMPISKSTNNLRERMPVVIGA